MALTRRELNLLILTIAAVLLLLSDRYVFSPVLAARDATSEMRNELVATRAEYIEIVEKKGPAYRRKWKQMVDDGLLDEPAKAEIGMVRYLNEISSRYNIALSSIQPEYAEVSNGTGEIEFIIAGSGYALDAYEFIWHVETSKLPLKLTSVQISSKDTETGMASIQLKISSLYSYEEPVVEEEVGNE